MNHVLTRFPVKCPCCGQESLAQENLDLIVDILATGQRIKLFSRCAHHQVVWVANEIERRQIEDYTTAFQLFVTAGARVAV